MLAVGLGSVEVTPYIKKYNGRVVIACYNSPSSITLSGDASTIEELKATFEEAKTFARVIKTGGKPYHSHHMKEAARIYEGYLNIEEPMKLSKSYRALTCPMISSLTGLSMSENMPNSVYWAANLVSPVLFNQAVQKMMALTPSINLVIEIGPHSSLRGPVRQICAENKLTKVLYMPTLTRDKHDGNQLLKLAGDIWARDTSIDVGSVTKTESLSQDGSITETEGSLLVDLPTYQWNYTKKLWLESRQSREQRAMKHARHDILGRRVLGLSNEEPVWRNILRHKDLPWLKHHFVSVTSLSLCLDTKIASTAWWRIRFPSGWLLCNGNRGNNRDKYRFRISSKDLWLHTKEYCNFSCAGSSGRRWRRRDFIQSATFRW